MPIYRAEYSLGEVDYVEAPSHYWATKNAIRLHPDWKLIKVSMAKEMKGVDLTDWNKLVLGMSIVECELCKKRVLPGHVFAHSKDPEDRPCHDAAGNVFCSATCRDRFQTTYGGSVKIVAAFDYDTWAVVKVPVPAESEKRKAWDQEWTLVETGCELPVLIATHRYQSMRKYQPHVEYVQEAG